MWIIPANAQWGSPIQLTFNSVNDYDPSISDDGSKIAFRSWSDRGESWVINSDGSDLLQLSSDWNYQTVISGDGSKIAFDALNEDSDFDLCIINSDGSGLNPVSEASFYWYFSINRDGSKIAFTPESHPPNIWIINSDGSGSTQLTNFDFAVDPSINADGSKIAFYGITDDDFEIFMINSDGSGLTQLTDNTADDSRPSISADGSKIAFESNLDGDNEIFVINSDGSGLTQLTDNTADDSSPSISDDGSKIAFMSDLDGDFEIFVINSDGSDLTQLTDNAAKDGWPSISADGSKIAFESYLDGDSEIFVIEYEGSSDSISGDVSYSYVGGGPMSGVTVDLKQVGTVIDTTSTVSTGAYNFNDILPGYYELVFHKNSFYDENVCDVEVTAGADTYQDMSLRIAGDLDDNGEEADAVDMNMMIQCSVGDYSGDNYFDLDANGGSCDAVDVNMMIQASVGDLIFPSISSNLMVC